MQILAFPVQSDLEVLSGLNFLFLMFEFFNLTELNDLCFLSVFKDLFFLGGWVV